MKITGLGLARQRIVEWAIRRMVQGVYRARLHEHSNLNPEDWDEVAYRMLMALLRRPKP